MEKTNNASDYKKYRPHLRVLFLGIFSYVVLGIGAYCSYHLLMVDVGHLRSNTELISSVKRIRIFTERSSSLCQIIIRSEGPGRINYFNQLKALFGQIGEHHQYIQNNLPGFVKNKFIDKRAVLTEQQLDIFLTRWLTHLDEFLREPPEGLNDGLASFQYLASDGKLNNVLHILDTLQITMQKSNEKMIALTRLKGTLFFVVHLGIISFIVIFIFFPMYSHIRGQFLYLIESNEKLQEKTRNLQEARLAALSIMEDAETARREAEEARRASYRLAAIVESSNDAIIGKDLKGTVISWNPGAEKLFGYTADEIIGGSVTRIYPENNPEALNEVIDKISAGEHLISYETKRRHKDGKIIDVSLTLSPIRNDAGHIIGISTIARDISDKKREEKKFHLAVEAAPNAMVMVNRKSEIVLVNSETERLFGYQRLELYGKSVETLVPERFRPGHADKRNTFFNNPQRAYLGVGRDLYGLHKDGSEIPVEIGLNPIHTEEGLFVLASLIDISERKIANKKIKKYTDDLKRSNEELEQFAFIASHDLQEPLRKVAAYGNLLEDTASNFDDQAKDYLHRMTNAAARMQDLILSLLEYSRCTRKEKLSIEKVNLADIVKAVLADLETSIRGVDAKIRIEKLPDVYADKKLIGRVFMNLISNALKFRIPGEPPEIWIKKGRNANEYVQVLIKDNGIGFDEKYKSKLFRPFSRLHGRGVYDGSGMGLAICQKIIQHHRGSIDVASSPGKGTTFKILLPSRFSGNP